MDTSEVAAKLGTSPRTLRHFLRSGFSTFSPVGSGARYNFTDREVGTLEKRFLEWSASGKPRPELASKPKPPTKKKQPSPDQTAKDAAVWAEEGPVIFEDIRNPRVRRRVLADAAAAEDRLMAQLIALGLHVMQRGDVA
jgi:hypothetical protein